MVWLTVLGGFVGRIAEYSILKLSATKRCAMYFKNSGELVPQQTPLESGGSRVTAKS
jgi:hypothetical protein